MTTRENDLLLQFMEMVFPKDLLRYFELTGFREEAVSEKDRFGVESGELIVSLEERDCLRNPIEGHTYRPNGFYEASKVRDFPLRDKNGMPSMKKTGRRRRTRPQENAVRMWKNMNPKCLKTGTLVNNCWPAADISCSSPETNGRNLKRRGRKYYSNSIRTLKTHII